MASQQNGRPACKYGEAPYNPYVVYTPHLPPLGLTSPTKLRTTTAVCRTPTAPNALHWPAAVGKRTGSCMYSSSSIARFIVVGYTICRSELGQPFLCPFPATTPVCHDPVLLCMNSIICGGVPSIFRRPTRCCCSPSTQQFRHWVMKSHFPVDYSHRLHVCAQ